MKVFVNAISIVEGGGIVVLKNLLAEMNKIDAEVTWYVAANSKTLSQLPTLERIIPLPITWANKSPFHLLFWYEAKLPRLMRQLEIDIFFSHTNFLPKRKLVCPSLLLVQHAGYFSEKYLQLYLHWNKKIKDVFLWGQRNKWVVQSVKKATMVTVQTRALANQIIEKVGLAKEKLVVIPHGVGLIQDPLQKIKEFPNDKIWRIGYITKFGVQKDFETAFKAINLLKIAGVPIKLVLTLNQETVEFKTIARQIKEYDIEENVENHGEMYQANQLKELYNSLHIFIFPSLCESFGFTLVEAMASGLPLIAADTKSNREVAGKGGELFAPENEHELVAKIYQFIKNQDLYTMASKNSVERAQEFSWSQAANEMLQIMRRMINKK